MTHAQRRLVRSVARRRTAVRPYIRPRIVGFCPIREKYDCMKMIWHDHELIEDDTRTDKCCLHPCIKNNMTMGSEMHITIADFAE